MSPCHHTYRRCASFALVLALVLIALPSLLNAQTAPKASTAQSDEVPPKVECFVGYQWLNPGGNIPDQTPPPAGPLAFKLPSIAPGFGTSLSYNFTKNLALEGNYGGNWNRNAKINSRQHWTEVHLSRRGRELFRAHTDRIRTISRPKGVPSSNGVAAVLGGGMDLKLWKPVTLRFSKPTSSSRAKTSPPWCPLSIAHCGVKPTTVSA